MGTCIQKCAHHTHRNMHAEVCTSQHTREYAYRRLPCLSHTWEHANRSVHITYIHRNMHTKDYSVSHTWEHAYRSVHVTHGNMHTEVCNRHTYGNMQTSVQPSLTQEHAYRSVHFTHTGTRIQKCTLYTHNMHTEVCISHTDANKPQTCLWSARQGATLQGGFY